MEDPKDCELLVLILPKSSALKTVPLSSCSREAGRFLVPALSKAWLLGLPLILGMPQPANKPLSSFSFLKLARIHFCFMHQKPQYIQVNCVSCVCVHGKGV